MTKVLLLQCTNRTRIPIRSVLGAWGIPVSVTLTPSLLCSICVGSLYFRGILLVLSFTSMCGIECFAILIRHSIYRSIYPSAINPSINIYPPHLPIPSNYLTTTSYLDGMLSGTAYRLTYTTSYVYTDNVDSKLMAILKTCLLFFIKTLQSTYIGL